MFKSKKKPLRRTAKKKQPQSKLDVWVKRYRNSDLIVKIFIIAVGLLLFWFGIVRPLDKLRFELAARDLSNLSTQIQKEIGPADRVETSKTCGYASAKFTKGKPTCSVRVVLYYQDKDFVFANSTIEKLSLLHNQPLIPGMEMRGFESYQEIINEEEQSFSQYTVDPLFMSKCETVYKLTDINANIGNFVIRSRCGDMALFEHFPLNN